MVSSVCKKGLLQIPFPRTLNEMETPFFWLWKKPKRKQTPETSQLSVSRIPSGFARWRCRLTDGLPELAWWRLQWDDRKKEEEEAFSFCTSPQELVKIIRSTDRR